MAPAGAVDEESWEDYGQSILAADLAAWKKKWQSKDAAKQKVKLVELSLSLAKLTAKMEDRIDLDDRLSRALQKVQEQQAFLEERVAMEPTRARPVDPDEEPAALELAAAQQADPRWDRSSSQRKGSKSRQSTVCTVS